MFFWRPHLAKQKVKFKVHGFKPFDSCQHLPVSVALCAFHVIHALSY